MTGALSLAAYLCFRCMPISIMEVLTNLLLSNGTAKSRRTWPFGVVRDVSRLTGTNLRQLLGNTTDLFVRLQSE